MPISRNFVAAAAVGAVTLTGCGGQDVAAPSAGNSALPQGAEKVTLDPADFTVDITHPYWPMQPGDRWVYEESEGQRPQRVEVTVLDRTRTMANGVEAREVHDRVTTPDGELIEDTTDWYAQDAEGNLWYLGEQTAEYQNGRVI